MKKFTRISDRNTQYRKVMLPLLILVMGVGIFWSSNQSTTKAARPAELATGSGHIRIPCDPCDQPGAFRNFAFSAVEDESGNTKGQAQLNNRLIEVEDHVIVQCLHINGNIATVSGVIKKSRSKANPLIEFPVGTPVIFRVQDNGEGENEPADIISLLHRTGDPGDARADCENPPATILFEQIPITGGNIQVHVQ